MTTQSFVRRMLNVLLVVVGFLSAILTVRTMHAEDTPPVSPQAIPAAVSFAKFASPPTESAEIFIVDHFAMTRPREVHTVELTSSYVFTPLACDTEKQSFSHRREYGYCHCKYLTPNGDIFMEYPVHFKGSVQEVSHVADKNSSQWITPPVKSEYWNIGAYNLLNIDESWLVGALPDGELVVGHEWQPNPVLIGAIKRCAGRHIFLPKDKYFSSGQKTWEARHEIKRSSARIERIEAGLAIVRITYDVAAAFLGTSKQGNDYVTSEFSGIIELGLDCAQGTLETVTLFTEQDYIVQVSNGTGDDFAGYRPREPLSVSMKSTLERETRTEQAAKQLTACREGLLRIDAPCVYYESFLAAQDFAESFQELPQMCEQARQLIETEKAERGELVAVYRSVYELFAAEYQKINTAVGEAGMWLSREDATRHTRKLEEIIRAAGEDTKLATKARRAIKWHAAMFAGSGFLGVEIDPKYQGKGVRLSGLTAGGPAEKFGLKVGDVVLRLDGTEIVGKNGLPEILKQKRPGDSIVLTVQRDGEDKESIRVEVKLALNKNG